MIDKNKTQELQYLMRYYHIGAIPLFDRGFYLGKVTDNLKYTDTDNALRTYKKDEYAIEAACETINDVISVVKKWNENVKVVVEFHSPEDVHMVSDDGFCYLHKKDTIKEEVFEGTFDEVCERFNKANNRFRYCNGTYYKFKDEKMREEYRYWSHLISDSRSFALYYPGNTVVD